MNTPQLPEIPPDTKDWTWVLERPCPECGFDCAGLDVAEIPQLVRVNAAEWVRVMGRADVRERPAPMIWSPLEYACHVRDVFSIFDERLQWMLREPDPLFDSWDQDAAARDEEYGLQDPKLVAEQLAAAATAIARSFEGVAESEWSRTGRRSDGSTFTVESLGRYLMHDPIHHLFDVRPT
jgi:hypothetical protein